MYVEFQDFCVFVLVLVISWCCFYALMYSGVLCVCVTCKECIWCVFLCDKVQALSRWILKYCILISVTFIVCKVLKVLLCCTADLWLWRPPHAPIQTTNGESESIKFSLALLVFSWLLIDWHWEQNDRYRSMIWDITADIHTFTRLLVANILNGRANIW